MHNIKRTLPLDIYSFISPVGERRWYNYAAGRVSRIETENHVGKLPVFSIWPSRGRANALPDSAVLGSMLGPSQVYGGRQEYMARCIRNIPFVAVLMLT